MAKKYRAVEGAPPPATLRQSKKGRKETRQLSANMPYERTNSNKTRS